MTNAKILLIILASLLIGASFAYSFSSTPEEQIEKQNKQNTKDCLSKINYWSWSAEIQSSIVACWKMELKKIVGWKSLNATGGIAPESPSKINCSIGTGSHDVRSLAKNYPWVAWWKNNNPSWITLGSKELEKAFDNAWILWTVWTARPAKEWSNYYWFPDLENWMRAKLLIIKRSYKNSTIDQYLRVWGTDSIESILDGKRTIASLSDDELIALTRKQIQKESGSLSNYIFTNVVICNHT